jgi:hypothetical protein
MLKTSIIGGVVGGLILFVWAALSWTVLPWHMLTLHSFKDPAAVAQIVQVNAPQSGIYLVPAPTQEATPTQGPLVFASVHLPGMSSSMVPSLVIELAIQIIAAFLVTWMLTKTKDLNYFSRIGFVLVFALTANVVTELPYWNWFYFDATYTLVMFVDLLIGWFLAGLVLAKLTAR